MIMINIKRSTYILILILTTTIFVVAFNLRYLFQRKDNDSPKVEITKGLGNNINVTVALPQIKKDIAPIVIGEFLSQTKITSLDNGGLKLADFKDDSVLAKYGFKKGDVVKEINGQRVNTIKEAIKICDALEEEVLGSRDGKDIGVVLDRDGEDIYMNYRVPEFVPEKVQYTMHLQKKVRR